MNRYRASTRVGEHEYVEYIGRAPTKPLDRFIDDIYCRTGVPHHRGLNVPPTPSAHLFVNLADRSASTIPTLQCHRHGSPMAGSLVCGPDASSSSSPKRVARIYRFARLILSVDARQPVDWSELAQAAGYFDQAQFSKELKDFTGHTPTAYLALRRRYPARRGFLPDHCPMAAD
jgi:AraC-like DNA-binding protein